MLRGAAWCCVTVIDVICQARALSFGIVFVLFVVICIYVCISCICIAACVICVRCVLRVLRVRLRLRVTLFVYQCERIYVLCHVVVGEERGEGEVRRGGVHVPCLSLSPSIFLFFLSSLPLHMQSRYNTIQMFSIN